MEETIDPTTSIINRTEEYIEYLNTDGKQWRIYGKCNLCGKCELNNNQPIPSSGDTTVLYVKLLLPDGTFGDWYRTLHWNGTPGESGVCVEEDFQNRKDIPLTPDCARDIPQCALSGVWISGI
jgi:hypothetical protein